MTKRVSAHSLQTSWEKLALVRMQGVRALVARRTSLAPPAHVRRLSAEAGARERILLDDDPYLAPYKSTKTTVSAMKIFGDVLVLSVVAGGVYEILYRGQARKAARAEEADQLPSN